MKVVAGGRGRRRESGGFLQLSLFEFKREEHGNTDPIRTDGRTTLAGVPAPDRGRIGGDRRLHSQLLKAEEQTGEDLDSLRRHLIQQGLTAQQAHDRAWEIVRERYLLLPPEQ